MTTIKEAEHLVRRFSRIVNQLKQRKIIRSERYIPDVVEWFVANKLNLKLSKNNQKGYDAKSRNGVKYQIKYRTDDENKSTGFEPINLKGFDFLLCVFLNKDNFEIKSIYKIPKDIVKKYTKRFARYSFRWNKKSKSHPEIQKLYPK